MEEIRGQDGARNQDVDLLEVVDNVTNSVRKASGDFFEISIGDNQVCQSSGSVQPLKSVLYNTDDNEMCYNIIKNLNEI